MMNTTTPANTLYTPSVHHKTTSLLQRSLRLVGGTVGVMVLLFVAWILFTNFVLTGLDAGTPAPSFRGQDLNGQPIQLRDYAGKPVMVTFWSPDCFACREELPALKAIAADPNADVTLLTIVSKVPVEEVQAFAKEQGLTFPILVDEAGTIAQDYKISGIPTSYFINPNGKVDHNVIGAGSEGALASNLTAWLSTCNLGEVCK